MQVNIKILILKSDSDLRRLKVDCQLTNYPQIFSHKTLMRK